VWEGPFIIKNTCPGNAYTLVDSDGVVTTTTWNAMHLKKYYPPVTSNPGTTLNLGAFRNTRLGQGAIGTLSFQCLEPLQTPARPDH